MLASRVHDACSQSGGVTRKRPAAVTSRGSYRFNPKEPATSTVLRYIRYLKAMEPDKQENYVACLDNTWPKLVNRLKVSLRPKDRGLEPLLARHGDPFLFILSRDARSRSASASGAASD